ncbi:MAG: hypothetical protein IJZ62_05990 [Clostridia bacterium]|nr:hypothetical protein [Clostridia bacterium]
MKKKYQVTMYCATGQYKPISTIVTMEQVHDDNLLENPQKKTEIIHKGIIAICHKKYWSSRDVKKYGYTKVRAREYKKEQV